MLTGKDNELVEIGDAIFSLSNLRILDLRRMFFTRFSCACAHIQGNRIASISPRIGSLHKLTVFNANDNQLTTLPNEFASLALLSELRITRNSALHYHPC
jgi:hypothetical protein